MGFTAHDHEPTMYPWGEPKKPSLWRRLFKSSKGEKSTPISSVYAPAPFAQDTFERPYTSYGPPVTVPSIPYASHPNASVPSHPYHMYSTPTHSEEHFTDTIYSSYYDAPQKSPISSSSLASTRSIRSSSSRPSHHRRTSTFSTISESEPSTPDEGLVLTLTSKYPTGVAADLYEPISTIVPQNTSLTRRISNSSYQAKHAVLRKYDCRNRHTRQTVHF